MSIVRPLAFRLPMLSALALAGCPSELPNIEPITPPESAEAPPDHGSWLSLDTSPDGSVPVMAYYDRELGALGFGIGTIDADGGVSWFYEKVDGYQAASGLDSGDIGKYASLKVAPDGTVWIASYNATTRALRFARRVAGSYNIEAPAQWVTGDIDVGPGVGEWASLDIASDGLPVVSYHDGLNGDLKVAKLAADPGFDAEATYTWNVSTVYEGAPFAVPSGDSDGGETVREGDAGEHTRLLADGANLYLAFYDRAEGSLRLAESQDDGTTWTVSRVAPAAPDGSRDVGQWPSILVDQGDLVISYHDVGNQDLIVATRGGSGTWSTEVVDAGEFVGADSEIIRRGGTLQVVYFDGQTNDMRLASKSGSTWTRELLGGETSAVGFHNEVIKVGDAWYAASYDFGPRAIYWKPLTDN